MAQGFDKFA